MAVREIFACNKRNAMFDIFGRIMSSISNIYTAFDSYPLPTFWNLKRYFIIDAAFNSINLLIIRIMGRYSVVLAAPSNDSKI